MKGHSHSFRITCDLIAVNLLESRKQRNLKEISNNQNAKKKKKKKKKKLRKNEYFK